MTSPRATCRAACTTGDGTNPSVGHDACSAPAGRWIEQLLPASPAAPQHPNAAGEQGVAAAITAVA